MSRTDEGGRSGSAVRSAGPRGTDGAPQRQAGPANAVTGAVPGGSNVLGADEIRGLRERLAVVPPTGLSETELIDQLAELTRLRRAILAREARLAVAYGESRQRGGAREGVPARRRDDATAVAIGLARQESPRRGSRFVGLARMLVRDLPITFAALQSGSISEWGATLVAQAVAVLSPEDRSVVDAALAGRLHGRSERCIAGLARALSYEIDPAVHTARLRRAQGERHVSVRPAPDTMAYLTALLPVADAVAVIASLKRTAATARARGDARSRSNVMADTLVEGVTGFRASCHAGASRPTVSPVVPGTVRPTASVHATGRTAGSSDSRVSTVAGMVSTEAQRSGANCPPLPTEREQVRTRRHPKDDPVASSCGLPRTRRPRLRAGDVLPGYGPPAADAETSTAELVNAILPEVADADIAPVDAVRRDAALVDAAATSIARRDVAPPIVGSARPPIEIGLVISAEALFSHDHGSARLNGADIPAWLARELVAADDDTRIRIRALYAHPATGQLVAMQSAARTVTGALRRFIAYRDQRCAMPYCAAPIQHVDHVVPHARRPETDGDSCRALCEQCNYLKEAPDLDTDLVPDPGHADAPALFRVTTPTGHRYHCAVPAVVDTLSRSA